MMWWTVLVIALGAASPPPAPPPPTISVVISADTWAQCRAMQQSVYVQPPAFIVSLGTCSSGPTYQ